jgi:2-polyprenyl-6-methoxyphenol hydroxylase-like FAD-dependent oxidoreductase
VSSSTQVIVGGGGPTGLTLAAELAGSGISCTLVEQRPERPPWSRAFGLLPRTLELMDMRGQGERFVAEGLPWSLAPVGDLKHNLDYGKLDSPFPFMLILPQHRTERILEEWAVKSGATIVRGARVTALDQDLSGVRVHVEGDGGERTLTGEYLVGCDGVHSKVREAAGIPFRGRAYEQSLVIADVRLDDPPSPEVYGRITRQGMVAIFPFGDGVHRMIVLDRERMDIPVDEAVDFGELRTSCLAIAGREFGLAELVWTSRFRSTQRQAAYYRKGRVLLAGDAAHTHIPSGGQGLQVGIQDAMNLGWKLAAHIRGHAAPRLLDSYEEERRPIATATLRKTHLAFKFETADSAGARLIRRFSSQLAAIDALQGPLLEEFAGFTTRYQDIGRERHRWVGRRVPDLMIRQRDGRLSRLYELLRERRFVLIDQTPDTPDDAPRYPGITTVDGWVVSQHRVPKILLVRPDGYAAWASDGPAAGLASALADWIVPLPAGGTG